MQASTIAARVALVAGVAAELTPQPDAGVVDVFGEDGRSEPRGDGHGGISGVLGAVTIGVGVRWSVSTGARNGPDPVVLPPLVRLGANRDRLWQQHLELQPQLAAHARAGRRERSRSCA